MRAVAGLLALVALAGCGRLFFFPDGVLRVLPSQLGVAYEDVFIESGEERLHAWFLPAPSAAERPGPGVLFLHGNAENISSHVVSVFWLPAHGFHVLLFDYRGYGNSSGRSDLESVQVDTAAALRTLRDRPEVDPEQLVVFGQSLGGSIALTAVERLQSEIPVRAVVVDSAFAGYRRIARDKLGDLWLTWPLQWPLSLLFPDTPRPVASIARLQEPSLLIVHGEADRVVPVEHGRRLHEAAPPDASYWEVPEAGHIRAFTQEAWRERLVAYLREALGGGGGGDGGGEPVASARSRSTSRPPTRATGS